MTIQDDSREEYQKIIFGLQSETGRHDADAVALGAEWELKTGSRKSFTTSGNIGFNHLHKMITRNWIFSTIQPDGSFTDEHYFVPAEGMKPWVDEYEATLKANISLMWSVVAPEKYAELSDKDKDFVEKTIKKGCFKKAPHISMKYVKKYGTKLMAPYDVHLKKLVLKDTD